MESIIDVASSSLQCFQKLRKLGLSRAFNPSQKKKNYLCSVGLNMSNSDRYVRSPKCSLVNMVTRKEKLVRRTKCWLLLSPRIISLLLLLFFHLFRAAPTAYEVPWLMVLLELQLPAYATATARWGLNLVCNLHCSQQCWILNPLSEARDWTWVLMDAILSHDGNSNISSILEDISLSLK